MNKSIRNFLLVYVLIAITLTTGISTICNYYLDQKDIKEHHDTLMAITAISYQSLLGEDLQQRPLSEIQKRLNSIPKKIQAHYPKSLFYNKLPNYYLDRFNFQVWNNSNQLLLHSAGKPRTRLDNIPDGFSDKIIDNQKWRVFSNYNPQTNLKTVLAEKYDTRFELGQRIAIDDFYIVLLSFPISAFLIWMIIKRGLRSLAVVAKELADRAPNHLDPVKIKNPPKEIKPVVDELNKLLQRLQEGFDREKRFASDAAHELRTPLAALKAQAQVALNTNDINEKNKSLKKVIASVNRNTHIVQQLLTMSKLVPEEYANDAQNTVNLSQVSREIIAMLAPQALEHKIDIEFIEKDKINNFIGNQTSIGILIRNLIENAIVYGYPNGTVSVKIYQEGSLAVLEIEDNGPGIPDEIQARVFERFYRALGNKNSGSGLGLAIVKQIASLHNAQITLQSPRTGTGLIVRVFFNCGETRISSDHYQERNKPKR
ncbi:MAG: ATP-binding protein [Legionellaceae bacterium]|nr:ATP-binding protein [Legionellaceae bacterium]